MDVEPFIIKHSTVFCDDFVAETFKESLCSADSNQSPLKNIMNNKTLKFHSDPASSKRWVIKIGSSLLTSHGQGLNCDEIDSWVEQLVELKKQGKEVVLVSSGSVAEGMSRLGWETRPSELQKLQAAAAVGQMGLIQAYESSFQRFSMHTAQILLTHEEIRNRQQYLNAKHTLKTLLELGVVPVINENDTVTTDEIRLGDNDNLAAMVANLIEADLLLILTDQQGVFDADPRCHQSAKLISETSVNDPVLDQVAGGPGSHIGSGGMKTKIEAARRAARSGAMTIIAAGTDINIIGDIAANKKLGTRLVPDQEPLAARKQWLAGQLQIRGKLTLDDGSVKALQEMQGASLLAVGVVSVEGTFRRGDLVACIDSSGVEIARGLVNYDAQETGRLIGQSSKDIELILGYVDELELIHVDDLVLL